MIGIYKIQNKKTRQIYIGQSNYKEVPVYKKKSKKWIINNKPVSTIPESRE